MIQLKGYSPIQSLKGEDERCRVSQSARPIAARRNWGLFRSVCVRRQQEDPQTPPRGSSPNWLINPSRARLQGWGRSAQDGGRAARTDDCRRAGECVRVGRKGERVWQWHQIRYYPLQRHVFLAKSEAIFHSRGLCASTFWQSFWSWRCFFFLYRLCFLRAPASNSSLAVPPLYVLQRGVILGWREGESCIVFVWVILTERDKYVICP